MNRYEELEKLYYKKLFFKYFIFISLIITILCILGYFFKKKTKTAKHVITQIKHKKILKNKSENNKTKIVKIEKKNINKKHKHLHFILPEINNTPIIQKTVPNQKSFKNKIKKSQLNNNINNNIKIIEKVPNLQILIQKFNETEDFDLAILIAKIYFKKNKLKNAQIWALKANNINPASYKSWILFADILQKEKKIKKAKEILKVYLDSYGQNDIIEQKLRSLNDK